MVKTRKRRRKKKRERRKKRKINPHRFTSKIHHWLEVEDDLIFATRAYLYFMYLPLPGLAGFDLLDLQGGNL